MRLDAMYMILDVANTLEAAADASDTEELFTEDRGRFTLDVSKRVNSLGKLLIRDSANPTSTRSAWRSGAALGRDSADSLRKDGDTFDKNWSFSDMIGERGGLWSIISD